MRFQIVAAFIALMAAPGAGAQSIAAQIAAGDREYSAMNAPLALALYEKAIASDSSNFEAQWKAARSAIDIGSYLPDASMRTAMYVKGERFARRAVSLRATDAEGHFSLARALGKMALSQSPRGRVRYGTEVRSEALECLKAQPRHAGCLHVMGMWNAEVMRLNGLARLVAKNILGGRVLGSATWKAAVSYMEEAVAIEPDRIVHWVDLGGVYRDVGDRRKARSAFETALALRLSDVNDPHYKAQARTDLSKL